MRIRLHKVALSAVLVIALLLTLASGVSATEPVTEPMPTETTASTEAATEPPTTQPPETVPEETIPEETEPEGYIVDRTSAIYNICAQMAETMQARQILVYDTNTDTILYSKSVAGGKLYPASITKLFSTYVALQYLDPDTVITAGDELDLVHEGSSIAFVPKGGQYRVKMLIEGMMLPSGNDAAMVVAAAAGRAIAGDENLAPAKAVERFVDEMNLQADTLGFEKSHFCNPDGWHTGAHYTCLNDLARISKLALENETIARYMRKHDEETNSYGGQYVLWENTNLLLDPDGAYYRRDAIGMKTGYTRPAGYSLMSAFTHEEGAIVVGLFGYTDKNERFPDAIRLANAAREQLKLEAERAQNPETSVG